MIKITSEQLSDIYGCTPARAEIFTDWLNRYMNGYGIDTRLRIAAFLAQIGHESGRLRYIEEIASGTAYEDRKDLGNTQPGDGRRFKGRGLIQLTGRKNYEEISKDVGIDFVKNPLLLAEPEYAVMSACWYWDKKDLNKYADAGNFREITRRINGGFNGQQDRETLYRRALEIIRE